MKPRKSPSKAAAERHQIPINKGAEPSDFYGKKIADAIGSSRMGEREDRNLKMGIGDVRREERKQEYIQEGKINRAFERQKKAKRKEA